MFFFLTADLHYLTICKWVLLEAPATMGRIQGPLSQGEFECCWVSPSAIRLGLRNYAKLQLSIINKHQPLTHSKQGNYILDPVCWNLCCGASLSGRCFFFIFFASFICRLAGSFRGGSRIYQACITLHTSTRVVCLHVASSFGQLIPVDCSTCWEQEQVEHPQLVSFCWSKFTSF